jgi:IS4 transposase
VDTGKIIGEEKVLKKKGRHKEEKFEVGSDIKNKKRQKKKEKRRNIQVVALREGEGRCGDRYEVVLEWVGEETDKEIVIESKSKALD